MALKINLVKTCFSDLGLVSGFWIQKSFEKWRFQTLCSFLESIQSSPDVLFLVFDVLGCAYGHMRRRMKDSLGY